MTRQEYLDGYSKKETDEEREEHFRRYYTQFVTESTRQAVISYIGIGVLRQSVDPHLNDIPLPRWDAIPHRLDGEALKQSGDYLTPAGWVCIAKQAAREIMEERRGRAAAS